MKTFIKSFGQLSPDELYKILKLRSEAFVVEQRCIYLDMDDKDQKAAHAGIKSGEQLIGCARILPPGIMYNEYASIGRVVTDPGFRGQGAATLLMKKSLDFCSLTYASTLVKITAQTYLIRFYEKLGFRSVENPFMIDNIPHQAMIWEGALPFSHRQHK